MYTTLHTAYSQHITHHYAVQQCYTSKRLNYMQQSSARFMKKISGKIQIMEHTINDKE